MLSNKSNTDTNNIINNINKLNNNFNKKDKTTNKLFDNKIRKIHIMFFFVILIIKFYVDLFLVNKFISDKWWIFFLIFIFTLIMLKNIYMLLISWDYIKNNYISSILYYMFLFIFLIVGINIALLLLWTNINLLILLLISDISFILFLILIIYNKIK